MEYFAFQWHITDSYTDIIDLVVENGVDTFAFGRYCLTSRFFPTPR